MIFPQGRWHIVQTALFLFLGFLVNLTFAGECGIFRDEEVHCGDAAEPPLAF